MAQRSSTALTAACLILLGVSTEVDGDCSGSAPTSDVGRLRQRLFCGYDKSLRPVTNNTALRVDFSIFVKSIGFNDYEGVLEISCIMMTVWWDKHLAWEEKEYGGINYLVVDASLVWLPELYHLNGVYDRREGALQLRTCLLVQSGELFCVYNGELSSLCTSDSRHWPFDTKNCSLEFGSLTHTSQDLVFSLSNLGNDLTFEHAAVGEWSVQKLKSRNVTTRHSCCENVSYSVAIGEVVIKRGYARHLAVMSAPILVFAMMTVCTFCISPLRQERLALCCWNILCHFLYMHYVINIVFGNHDTSTPHVVLYFRDSLVMAVTALVWTVIGRRFAMKTTAPYSFLVAAATSMAQFAKIRTTIPFSFSITHSRLLSSAEEGGGEDDHDAAVLVGEPTVHQQASWMSVIRLMDFVIITIFILLYFIFMLTLLM